MAQANVPSTLDGWADRLQKFGKNIPQDSSANTGDDAEKNSKKPAGVSRMHGCWNADRSKKAQTQRIWQQHDDLIQVIFL